MRKTKIICTIGPATKSYKHLESLIINGMDVARINTSHSSKDEILEIVGKIREISLKKNTNIAIMLDLQGPKIRIGILDKDLKLRKDQKIVFTINDKIKNRKLKNQDRLKNNVEDEPLIPVDYNKFLEDVKEEHSIFIDDGIIECRILNVQKKKGIAEARVIRGGILKSHKGINLPGLSLSISSVTERDIDFLNFGLDIGADFIAQSFVRDAEDVKKIKSIIRERGSHAMVIAKIEKHEAVRNFDSILRQADSIMIARGDLGVELPEEDVPNIQKEIIIKSNRTGKPVITATQMLDSMIRNPRPTRAEVSDVANAIFDGSDAIMLSGETAVGNFPLESLKMMVRIINRTEEAIDYKEIMHKKFEVKQNTITEAISFAACEIAYVLGTEAIITSTKSGSTARQISKNRPKSIIIGISPHDWVVRQLMLTWGVLPAKAIFTDNINTMIETVTKTSEALGFLKSGDRIVITGGVLVNKPGSTNFINVKEVE
ncbi:MAG: pyruvate kinase [Actinobacteria bacterium]|nr:pyruvate kinase [Actinomycetota bacterium]